MSLQKSAILPKALEEMAFKTKENYSWGGNVQYKGEWKYNYHPNFRYST